MKKIMFLTIAILLTYLSNAQQIPQLRLTPDGVAPIVVTVNGLSSAEIYKEAKNWVQETYKNPEMVLKANIENEKIRIDGFSEGAWWFKSLGVEQRMDMEYTVEIAFKNGRYRFEYSIGQFYVGGGQRALYSYSSFYNKRGEIRKMYTDAVPSLELTMNELSQSFYEYVSGKTSSKDEDW